MSRSNREEFFQKILELDLATVQRQSHELNSAAENVGEFQRTLGGIVSPKDSSKVSKLVALANEYEAPLYPASCGKNWGYGSRLPVESDGVCLDLSSLNKILKIDETHGVAHIEPGVTQGQLADTLNETNSTYYLDVTGSGADTSVLGNALERGVAYSGLRVDQVRGLKVVLGRGDVMETGFGNYQNNALKGLYPHGLGPNLKDLFFQSNFGVVVEAQIQLKPRPEKLVAVSQSISSRDLLRAVESVRDLLKQGVLQGIPHIADKERILSTMAPLVQKQNTGLSQDIAREIVSDLIPGDWVLTTAVSGSPSLVSAKLKTARQELKKYGRGFTRTLTGHSRWENFREQLLQQILPKQKRSVLRASKTLSGFHLGQPSDAGVQFLKGDGSLDVDKNPTGFLLCTPLAPLEGDSASRFIDVANTQARKHSVTHAMTLNLITHSVLEAVISVHFDRSNRDECQRAHKFVLSLNKEFSSNGFYPYRININEYGLDSPIPRHLNRLNHEIKNLLDPKGIIAPGRYVYCPSNHEKAVGKRQGARDTNTESLSL